MPSIQRTFTVWLDHSFSCSQLMFWNSVIPLLIVIFSFVLISIEVLKYYKNSIRRNNSNETLISDQEYTKASKNYGTIHWDSCSRLKSSTTLDIETKPCRWTAFTISRIVISIAQIVLFIYAIHGSIQHIHDTRKNSVDVVLSHVAHFILWIYLFVLSVLNFSLSKTPNHLADKICVHLNSLYFFDFVVNVLNARSYYINYKTNIAELDYRVCLCTTLLDLLLISIIMNESRNKPSHPVIAKNGRILSGEGWSSISSSFTYAWARPIMKIGYERTITDEDMMEVTANNQAKNIMESYYKQKNKNIVISFIRSNAGTLVHQAIHAIIWSIIQFVPPLILAKIVDYIENPKGETIVTVYLYVLGMFVAQCIQTITVQKYYYLGRILSIRVQSIITGEVFAKSLRLRGSNVEKDDLTDTSLNGKVKGNINNLLSVDAQKIGEMTAVSYYAYSCPIRVITSIWCLYSILGSAALWGGLLTILCQPVIYLFGARFQNQHETVMKATDKRLKLINELLSSIRIVKFFAWENNFRNNINDARSKEIKAIRSRLMTFMWMINSCFFVPVFVMTVVFYIYTREHKLTASVAFTSLALFNGLRTSIDDLPANISLFLQALVSLRRVEAFLKEDEVETLTEELPLTFNENRTAVGFINNATFSWEKSSASDGTSDKVILKNLNLSFPSKKFSIVCGPTGSGKSTLLASLLGETYCVKGSAVLPRVIPDETSLLGGAVSGVAYVAQTAWLQNCSIRDNILFGLPYDKERYEAVLYMTALTRDLDIFEFGDATEIGEKGIALSGGQKQRVSIARAVYSQANILLLDDCLSAVDAHTAKHLYDYCLMGPLMKDRTVILVTHYVGLCMDGASYIVALKDGQVQGAGSPKEVLKSGALGEELARSRDLKSDNDEKEGPIPTVPKQLSQRTHRSGDGKLIKEEGRAEGSVSMSVYKSYIDASGGIWFGVLVIFLFVLAQGSVLLQDYWIKVWSHAYDEIAPTNNSLIYYYNSLFNNYLYVPVEMIKTNLEGQGSIDTLYYFRIYVLLGLLALLMTTFRSLSLINGSINASKQIHSRMLEEIISAKIRFFDVTPLGRIINRFSFDMEVVDQAVATNLSFFLFFMTSSIFVILVICKVTPLFLIPGSIIAPFLYRMCVQFIKSSRDVKRLNSVSRSPIYSQFHESISGAVTLRAFGCQRRFLEENYTKIDNNIRSFVWLWGVNMRFSCIADILGSFLVFSTGIALVLARNWIDPGLAGLSLSYALSFTHQLLMAIRLYAVNEMYMNSVERVLEYCRLDRESSTHIPDKSLTPKWPETGALEVKDLVVKYSPDAPAILCNMSFKTNPFEKVGVVGRTGSGKSTLTLSIFRFMDPTSGTIKIDGIDIQNVDLYDLRSRITIIPQDPVLFSGTIRSNLDPFEEHDDIELWTALKRSHLIDEHNVTADGEEKVTLESSVTENGANWSQGQRQLISLARALVKKSNLIILDEATSSIDHSTDRKIQETIRTEFRHASVLCVAHRLRTVADYDRILVLDQGKVVEFDTPYRLITQNGGIFQQMCVQTGEYDELLRISKSHAKSI